jgi:molybdopterin/thiamine biosynthesis adenylyltransferase
MDRTRHMALFDASQTSVTLIGAGGIGAMVALNLAKMGVGFLTVYDDDEVNQTNCATQLYGWTDIGQMKVHALHNILAEFVDDLEMIAIPSRVKATTPLRDFIVTSAVDSINARKDIWKAVMASNPRWYLDARMSAEEFHLYTVDMKDAAAVQKYLDMISSEHEEDIPEIPCTMKATFYTGSIAGGIVASTVRKIASNIKPPFMVVYNMLHNVFVAG